MIFFSILVYIKILKTQKHFLKCNLKRNWKTSYGVHRIKALSLFHKQLPTSTPSPHDTCILAKCHPLPSVSGLFYLKKWNRCLLIIKSELRDSEDTYKNTWLNSWMLIETLKTYLKCETKNKVTLRYAKVLIILNQPLQPW